MVTRSIQTEQARGMLLTYLQQHPLPMMVEITKGRRRSTQQNRLQRQWMLDLAEQKPESTAEEWRGYCKLRFGVPILRSEREGFADLYDTKVRPFSYEQKIEFMQEPWDFPVTRLMTVKQKTAYLDAINKHFSEQGVVLTNPEDLKWK